MKAKESASGIWGHMQIKGAQLQSKTQTLEAARQSL